MTSESISQVDSAMKTYAHELLSKYWSLLDNDLKEIDFPKGDIKVHMFKGKNGKRSIILNGNDNWTACGRDTSSSATKGPKPAEKRPKPAETRKPAAKGPKPAETRKPAEKRPKPAEQQQAMH